MPNSVNPTLRVLIVGCGNIAGGFDENRPTSEWPLTHAGAYLRDGRFKLNACVEPNDRRRQEFMAAWNIPVGFRNISEVLQSKLTFDVVSICSPTSSHAEDVETALQLSPKLIFCEKPITLSLTEAEKIVNACKNAGVLLAVNYSRRWDPDVSKLASDLQSGAWGTLRSVTGWYSKGIANNGSHMLDLLHMLLGPLTVIRLGRPIHDFFPDDPSIPVWLECSTGVPIHLACGHAGDYARFELQFAFSRGVLSMEDGGLRWRTRTVIESEIFKGYKELTEGTIEVGQYPVVMQRAINNIHQSITAGEVLASSGTSAIEAQRLCQLIKNMKKNDWFNSTVYSTALTNEC